MTIGDGIHMLRVRAFDAAGNVTEHMPLTFQVDGTPPRIRLSESWYIWESGEVNVVDGQSGLAGVEIEIRDPQGRWPKISRAYEANGDLFTANITWDRRFPSTSLGASADGTLAPIGTYQVVVKAFDRAGNFARETASIFIPAPNLTPTPLPTRTPLPTPTFLPSLTPGPSPLPFETATPTRTPVVSAFGALPTPILDGQSPIPPSTHSQSSVLWGAAALTAMAGASGLVLAARRRRKAEEERQAAEAAQKAAQRNTAQAQQRETAKAQNDPQGKAMPGTARRNTAQATQKGPNWIGIIIGGVLVVMGAAMTFIGLGFGAELEPGGFFIAGAGALLAAIGAEIVTQSLGSLRPSWWPEHILNIPTRK